MISRFSYAAFLPIAVAVAACGQLNGTEKSPTEPTLTVEQRASQQVEQLRMVRTQETAFLTELAAAVREEPKNEAWATSKERELRDSYARVDAVPKGALETVDCRQSKCALQFGIESKSTAETAVRQELAIDQWAAWGQSCAYTLAREPDTGPGQRTVRVFLDCGQDSDR